MRADADNAAGNVIAANDCVVRKERPEMAVGNFLDFPLTFRESLLTMSYVMKKLSGNRRMRELGLTPVTIYLDKAILAKLDKVAKAEGRKRSAMVVRIVAEAIR